MPTHAPGVGSPLPIGESVGEVHFADPFRRLEDEGSDVRGWEAALDEEARLYLRQVPGFAALVDRLRRQLRACGDPVPARGGDRWFYAPWREPGAGQSVMVTERLGEPGRELIAANALTEGINAGIDCLAPSPDGAWVAVGVSSGGDEHTTLRFVDTATGQVAARSVVNVSAGAVAWLPDSRGVYCFAGDGCAHRSLIRGLLYVEPAGERAPVDLPPQMSGHRFELQLSGDGRYLGIVGNPAAPRLLHVLDRAAGTWAAPAPVADGDTLCGAFAGDRYYAVTTAAASRGRLVAVGVGEIANALAWREIVPEDPERVLRAVAPSGDGLVLCYATDGASELRVVSRAGEPIVDVPLPGPGLMSVNPRSPGQYGAAPPLRADAAGLTFSFSAIGRSPVLMRYETTERRLRTFGTPALVLDHVEARTLACSSTTYDLITDASADSRESRPTLIVAYGGWNAVSTSKGYLGPLAPFIEAGGNVVFAHVPGDATFGAHQWHGGRRGLKQRSFDGVYAVAEDLVERGIAPARGLAVYGASNGGLLAGAALTQRPDLFRAVIALVPLFDMCRFVRERFAEQLVWEYGDPRLPEQAAWLAGYSPYHNVEIGVDYPATLIVCAAGDVRAHPWHGRKMVAMLRHATAGRAPILLRVHPGYGHLSAGDFAPPWLIAEWLGFAMEQLELRLPEVAHAIGAREIHRLND